MRFSLQDVKKSVQRLNSKTANAQRASHTQAVSNEGHGGELAVTLRFLRTGELQNEIQQLIAYHERLLERPQRDFLLDEARACIGDYRLAHCLLATLSYWYSWKACEWVVALQGLNATGALAELASPMHLRLALYTYVSELHHGFLGTRVRGQALQAFAEIYGISVADVEYLLVIDSEAEALLMRQAAQPPTPQEVVALYNQWVFEAALCNASDVHFVLDCRVSGEGQARESSLNVGLGAVIKRLCYLARKLGVYYDLAYEHTVLDGQLPSRLLLTLYGPQDVTGTPQQYGLRLARLCRLLLGYGISRRGAQKRAVLKTPAIVEAVATVHFLQRTYKFVMNADLLQLLPVEEQHEERVNDESSTLFDSSIEQAFSEAFIALASGQGVDGWRLEREPEPLLLERSLFIADFALTRGQRRIYVEILGFWTPSYRERKIQKLQQLKERDDLLLAIPLEAKDAFAVIEADFPIIFYERHLAVTDVLQVLRSHYDDFAERLEQIDSAAVRALVRRDGWLPERACYEVLHCYRRSELARAVEHILDSDIMFVSGVGLYKVQRLEQLKSAVLIWLSSVRRASLSEVVREVQAQWEGQAVWDEAVLESLLTSWTEIHINRTSIFDTTVELAEEIDSNGEEGILSATQLLKQGAKKQVHERRTFLQKRKNGVQQEAKQEGLWD